MKKEPITLQQKLGFFDSDLRSSKHDEIMLWVDRNAFEIASEIIGTRNFTLHCQKWEKEVTNRHYLVGFIDFWIETCCIDLSHGDHYDEARGGWDSRCKNNKKIAIEVKATLPSIGELIRQIRMYQNYARASYVLVTPDPAENLVSLLSRQGIATINSNRTFSS